MNQSPWYVENMAEYERERIRQEMGQIRLGERVSKPQVQGPRPIARLWHLVRRWFATRPHAAGRFSFARPVRLALRLGHTSEKACRLH